VVEGVAVEKVLVRYLISLRVSFTFFLSSSKWISASEHRFRPISRILSDTEVVASKFAGPSTSVESHEIAGRDKKSMVTTAVLRCS